MREEIRLRGCLEPSKLTVASSLVDQWLPAIRSTIRPTTSDHDAKIVEGYLDRQSEASS